MSLGLLITDRNLESLTDALKARMPDVEVHAWPDMDGLAKARFMVTWRQPQNVWQQLPNVEVVCSLGAGVDGLIKDPYLPSNLTLVRIVDLSLSTQMADFVLSSILLKNRRLDDYLTQQQQCTWKPQPRLERNKVAILGVGQIGQVVGQRLHDNGFEVTGWSRRNIPDVVFDVKVGTSGFEQVLQNADYVVSILPSTPQTHDILNREAFKFMQSHACVINVGRGDAVNENDLIDALNEGEIGSAILDVVKQEPLPEEHPLWLHDKVFITPHIAAITDPEQVVEQIVANYLAHLNHSPLKNVVDRDLGY